jgi:hypothetical protein
MKNVSLYILLLVSILACSNKNEKASALTEYFKLPKQLKEVSGIIASKNNTIWALADSGNPNEVYEVDASGAIVTTIELIDVQNNDWEAITSDTDGSLYIGDFGNNDNARKDLAIYKIDKNDLTKTSVSSAQQTTFYYPEQTDFPSKKKNKLYDCEAFFEMNGNFYLFTKNRSSQFDGTTILYKVPNKQGNFAAQKIGEFKTCADYNTCCITAASISPDKKKIVLLTHSKVWLFENFDSDLFFKGKASELELEHYSQKEAISFTTNDELLIGDEKVKKTGGTVYKVSLSKLKSKP